MRRSRRDIPYSDFWMGKPYDKSHGWVEQIEKAPCAGGTKCSHQECLSNKSQSRPPLVRPPCTCYNCQHQHQHQHQHHNPTPPPSPSMSCGSKDEVIRRLYCCTSSVKRGREQREPSPPPEKAQCSWQKPVSPCATVCPGCHSRHATPALEFCLQTPKSPSASAHPCCSCRRVFGWENFSVTRGPTPTPSHSYGSTGNPRNKPPQAKGTCKRHIPAPKSEIRHCDCYHKDYHSDTGSHVSPYDDMSSDCSSVRVIPDYDREVDESRCGAYHRCRPKYDCRQGWVCGRK